MEKSLQELYDEKIHILQKLETELTEKMGYEEASKFLEKIYHVVLIQKNIDKQEEIIWQEELSM